VVEELSSRRPAGRFLASDHRLLRAAFQQAPVAMVMVETNGVVRRVNVAAARLLGETTGTATGKPFASLFVAEAAAAIEGGLTQANGTREMAALGARTLSGADCRVVLQPLTLSDGPAVVLVTLLSSKAESEVVEDRRDALSEKDLAYDLAYDFIVALSARLLSSGDHSRAVCEVLVSHGYDHAAVVSGPLGTAPARVVATAASPDWRYGSDEAVERRLRSLAEEVTVLGHAIFSAASDPPAYAAVPAPTAPSWDGEGLGMVICASPADGRKPRLLDFSVLHDVAYLLCVSRHAPEQSGRRRTPARP
jgi:hypothetical protein